MELKQIREALQRCRLFEDLNEGQYHTLAGDARQATYAEGKAIYAKGSDSDRTFGLITSGEAEALSEAGMCLRTLGPGEIIGEIGALSPQQKRTITLRAGKPMAILEWNIDDIAEKMPELIKKLKDLAWRRVSDWYE
jgi:CRP-like cAMP-binding protein